MQVRILGSGGWEGVPSPFCGCRVCKTAVKNQKGKDFRFRPCLQVVAPNGTFLIECPPDIRVISQKFSLPAIKDYFISHWHFDHAYGLMELHAWSQLKQRLKVFCSQKTKEWLAGAFGHIAMDVLVLKPFKAMDIYGARVTPFPVYHMRSQDEGVPEGKLENTFGFLIESRGKKLAYTADFYCLPKKSLELIKGSDVLVADGTCLLKIPKEYEYDPDHLHGKAILDKAVRIGAKQTFFHSINHLHGKTHSELAKALPKGMAPTWDGQVIEL